MISPHASDLVALLREDGRRWAALTNVEALGLPQGCVGAGFVRNLVWDRLHDRVSDSRDEDVDVLFFDPVRVDAAYESELERRLAEAAPDLSWSVRNQARMHLRNGDRPYRSVEDAMRFWPETATAVAVRRDENRCEILAPFGLDDLMSLVLRPTSRREDKLAAFNQRVAAKRWMRRWPKLTLFVDDATGLGG